jgi:hypothetical protein
LARAIRESTGDRVITQNPNLEYDQTARRAALRSNAEDKGQGLKRHFAALLIFTVLTGVMAFPVVDIMSRGGVPGWEGDNLYYVHSMWWWKHSLFELHTSPFVDPESFYPVGRENGRSELSASNTIAALPVTAIFGPVVAYDLTLLLTFVLTGFFTYLWVRELTGRWDAGVLAGAIAAFMPLRFAHLVGHLPLVTTQWIPLTLYAIEKFVARRSLARGLFVGAGVASVLLGSWYYEYALVIMLPAYIALRTWRSPVWRDRQWWIGLTAAGALALVILSPFLYQMFRLQGQGALARSLAEMDSWSLNPYDIVIPNALHPLFGDAASRAFPHQRAMWVEAGVTVGIVSAVLALVGWLSTRRRSAAAAGLIAVWLISYVIALGPTLHWKDEQVRVPVPVAVAQLTARTLIGGGNDEAVAALRDRFVSLGMPIPLPSVFMYKFVPLTSSMRVMARFTVWTSFMTAALAGFGLIAVVGWAERRWGLLARGAVPVMLASLILFESLNVIPVEPLGPRAVDKWLALQSDDMVIAELPIEQAQRSLQNYWMTVNQRKNFFGWTGDSFPPPIQVERATALKDFPAPATLEYLRQSSATHLLITPSQVPNWSAVEPVLRQSPALADELTIGDVRVYRIVR